MTRRRALLFFLLLAAPAAAQDAQEILLACPPGYSSAVESPASGVEQYLGRKMTAEELKLVLQAVAASSKAEPKLRCTPEVRQREEFAPGEGFFSVQ